MDIYAYAAVIGDKMYAYGQGHNDDVAARACRADFSRQIAGASKNWQQMMWQKVDFVPLDPDRASEIAEWINAPALAWE